MGELFVCVLRGEALLLLANLEPVSRDEGLVRVCDRVRGHVEVRERRERWRALGGLFGCGQRVLVVVLVRRLGVNAEKTDDVLDYALPRLGVERCQGTMEASK
jgi:hypothetical protein